MSKKLTQLIDFRKLDASLEDLVQITKFPEQYSPKEVRNAYRILDFVVEVKRYVIRTEGKTEVEMFPHLYANHVFQPEFKEESPGKVTESDKVIPPILFWENSETCQEKFPNTLILLYRTEEIPTNYIVIDSIEDQ